MPKKLPVVPTPDLRLQRRGHFYVSSKTDYPKVLGTLIQQHKARQDLKSLHATGEEEFIFEGRKIALAFSIFQYERTPSFLTDATGIQDILHGVLVLVGSGGRLAVYTAGGVTWSDGLVDTSGQRISGDIVARFLSGATKIQRLGVRNMAITRSVIRAQSYEADDLQSTLPPLGQSRKIVNTVRVTLDSRSFTANPSTGLITEAGARITAKEYAQWAVSVMDALEKAPDASGFLGYFAQPVKMKDLPSSVHPTGLLLDLEWLCELIEQGEAELILRGTKEHSRLISSELAMLAIRQIFSNLAEITSDANKSKYVASFTGLSKRFNITLHKNKTSYSLHERRLSKISVRYTRTGEHETIAEALRSHRCVQLAMSDIRYAFAYGELFLDERIRTQAEALRGCIRAIDSLADCTEEKPSDKVHSQISEFPEKSIFRAIESDIARDDDILICDDISGDEWSDYIGFHLSSSTISLYHAKHNKDRGTSASKFQEVLGQAMKNLGRLAVTEEDVKAKSKSWAESWRTGYPNIPRIRRSHRGADPAKTYISLSASTATRRRVCVVVTFIYADVLEHIIATVTEGKKIPPHQTQLIMLLVAFVSACREMGAEAVLLCPKSEAEPSSPESAQSKGSKSRSAPRKTRKNPG